MRVEWPVVLVRALPLSLLLSVPSLLPQPASALSLNPLDYYEVDYRIAVSHTVVEPEEVFSVAVSADIRCIKDMPFGVDQATGVASVLARHTTSDLELTLLDSYEVTIDGVPDWEGDEYQFEESMDLAFPSDAPEGVYALVARLDRVSLDGWNVTALIPGSYRTFGIASITCATEEAPPAPPTPEPGTLRIAVLGHDFRPSLDADGVLLDGVDADLIEGEVSLVIEPGTRCEESSGDPLAYVSVAEDPTPPAYSDGVVIAAFTLQPSGAQFSPAIELGIAYSESALPDKVDAASLVVAWYDRQAGLWRGLDTTVDAQRRVAYAEVVHFSSVGLLAPTTAPGPAAFAVRDLTASPARVAPLDKVQVSVTALNTGGTQGTYHLEVSINDRNAYTQDVVLEPRESRTIRFLLARSQPGIYRVEVAGLMSEFTVLAPAVAPGGADDDDPPASSSGSTTPASNTNEQGGMHPIYIALLALAGVAFLTLVVLVLAGVL